MLGKTRLLSFVLVGFLTPGCRPQQLERPHAHPERSEVRGEKIGRGDAGGPVAGDFGQHLGCPTSYFADPPGGETPPIRTTVISDTDPSGLLLLAAGADDGVEEGYRFTVYRGSEFVAKVRVERCLKEAASARVEIAVPGRTPMAGDAAATRLD